MSRRIITKTSQIIRLVTQLEEQISDSSVSNGNAVRFFQSGEVWDCREYHIHTGKNILVVSLPNLDDGYTRIPFLFTLNPKINNFSSDMEVNFPMSLDRRIAGCFVKDHMDNKILICNRGIFTIYRSPIKKEIALAYLSNLVIEVDDAGKSTNVVHISTLGSPDMFYEITQIIIRLKNLKRQQKADQQSKRMPY